MCMHPINAVKWKVPETSNELLLYAYPVKRQKSPSKWKRSNWIDWSAWKKSKASGPREYGTMCDLTSVDTYQLTVNKKVIWHGKKLLHPKCVECNKEFPTRIDCDTHLLLPEHSKKTDWRTLSHPPGRRRRLKSRKVKLLTEKEKKMGNYIVEAPNGQKKRKYIALKGRLHALDSWLRNTRLAWVEKQEVKKRFGERKKLETIGPRGRNIHCTICGTVWRQQATIWI